MNSNPRLSIPITREQQRLLQQYIPWGSQSTIFRLIIDDLIKMMQRHGSGKVLGAFLSRAVELDDLINIKVE